MLKNVKSSYFAKIVFSYIDEKQKLKLVKYNKSLQQKMDISINNYIHFKGNYIIYESKGKGKEYDDNNNLIFEGEYLNGERNGKGKEYNFYFNTVLFEGEYLNGKKFGKGKQYYNNSKILFEGEYLNDKRNGIGKEYDYIGVLDFEGEYLNGNRFKTIKYDINDNIIYELLNGNVEFDGYKENVGLIHFECEYLNGKKMEKEKNIFIVMDVN